VLQVLKISERGPATTKMGTNDWTNTASTRMVIPSLIVIN